MTPGSLAGLKVAVDVQHLYQPDKPWDHGSVYTLASGAHVMESQASTAYAAHAADYLAGRGARVLVNDPLHGVFTGHYWQRNRAANALGCQVYLACHVNAGGGDYYLAEYMLGCPGAALGASIGAAVKAAFPVIHGAKSNPLIRGQRGAVCIEACAPAMSAIVLEPFFGDRSWLQAMLEPQALARLGLAIGEGVESWWGRTNTAVA